jgi:Carbamoyltransferase C-terminus
MNIQGLNGGTAHDPAASPAAVQSRIDVSAVLNTPFNREPIGCTPGDALRTFVLLDLDALVSDNLVVEKEGPARRCSL